MDDQPLSRINLLQLHNRNASTYSRHGHSSAFRGLLNAIAITGGIALGLFMMWPQ